MALGRAWLLGILLVLSSLGGGWFVSFAAGPATADDMQGSIRTFTSVYDLVEANFADPVTPEKAIYDGAIPGMLRTLDPHSSFFDPKEVQLFREGQRGQYFGVGMLVGYRNSLVTVIHPFEGSPARKAGIRIADGIVAVNGKNTEKMGTSEVVDLLKGPRGTPVKVSVRREGVEKPLSFDLVRDEVKRPSVTKAIWLQRGVAYLHIEQFNENTSREMETELKRLGEDKLEGLILDMRDNPGGILQEAVAVSERFLDKGQAIVSQRGRISNERGYVGKRGNTGRKYPIVVMVNRFSASAAEIVAGALQDHDRAWILGDNTFGKGLVQAPYPLSEDCSLLLTIARFYTPSGRLIQRDYSKGSFFDYYYRKNTATQNSSDVRMTDSGRTVFGGGGIAPDEKFTPPALSRFQAQLLGRFAFFYFAARHFGPKEPGLPQGWEPDETILQEFRVYLRDRAIPYSEGEFADNLDWVKRQLKVEMYGLGFGREEADKLAVTQDPEVAKAVECLPKSKALIEKARNMVARRNAVRAVPTAVTAPAAK